MFHSESLAICRAFPRRCQTARSCGDVTRLGRPLCACVECESLVASERDSSQERKGTTSRYINEREVSAHKWRVYVCVRVCVHTYAFVSRVNMYMRAIYMVNMQHRHERKVAHVTVRFCRVTVNSTCRAKWTRQNNCFALRSRELKIRPANRYTRG